MAEKTPERTYEPVPEYPIGYWDIMEHRDKIINALAQDDVPRELHVETIKVLELAAQMIDRLTEEDIFCP